GDVLTLDQVNEREGGAGCFLRVKEAYENFLKQASALSDSICKICRIYDAPSHEDYLRHMISDHPDHLAASIPKEPEQDDPSILVWGCCGKEWKTAQARRMHMTQIRRAQAKETAA